MTRSAWRATSSNRCPAYTRDAMPWWAWTLLEGAFGGVVTVVVLGEWKRYELRRDRRRRSANRSANSS
jgi:hypothetical protein